jgi:hypothetical protein
MLSFFFPDRLGAPASRAREAEAPMLVNARSSSERRSAILDYYCDGGFAGGGVAGGGSFGLGLVLGGGGGGFCSGAPPGCELGELEGGGAVLGLVVVSLGGELAGPPGLFACSCEHAPTDSASAATHSNNRLRFIGSPLKGIARRKRGVASRVPLWRPKRRP